MNILLSTESAMFSVEMYKIVFNGTGRLDAGLLK